MRERDIFIEALQRATTAERDAYLGATCAGDLELRQRVEELLVEHDKQASFFLDAPLPGADVTQEQPIAERPGMQIGPYKLLQQIGEGGFGVVFMAEQTEPVRRKVALKVIKPGMDTRHVIARFEAERQALAVMDHPNIARVLEGGATVSGRPYFVMELVRGVPITTYTRPPAAWRCRARNQLTAALAEDVGKQLDKVLDAILRVIAKRGAKPRD